MPTPVPWKADGVGFEPTSDFRRCRFSRPVHSTALPPIRAATPCAADVADPILTCFLRRPDAGFDGLSAVSYSYRGISPPNRTRGPMGGISNRMKEVKRRRHRRQKLAKMQTKLKKATTSEKLAMAEKLRKMTAGCNDLIARMGLEDRKR